MGALCCCQRMEDLEELSSYPAVPIFQQICFPSCVRAFLRVNGTLFHATDGHEVETAMQTMGSPSSAGFLVATPLDTSPDTYRAPPRPLPYNVDPRYVRLQRDGLVSRREKVGISQLHTAESEPLRSDDSEPLQKRNGVDYDEESQGYQPESPGKRQQNAKSIRRVESVMSLGEDEDICPTCLDGYNTDNPRIITQCGHHFHLGCIYEWMERSKYCPVCDQEMVFSESP